MKSLNERHKRWVKKEGGIEHPTKLETLQQPEQQKRIEWLKKHCYPAVDILDLGCNWGYILNELNGRCGVDINPENIEKAIREFPTRNFLAADITKHLPFENEQYAIVILADVLEHLNYPQGVSGAITEALRIARGKLLVTLPYKLDKKFALCFKHSWLLGYESLGYIVNKVLHSARKVTCEMDDTFFYIEATK